MFADDDADHNIFTLKVPGMLTLKEADHNSAIVPQLAPASGSWWCARRCLPRSSAPAWPPGCHSAVQTLLVAGAVTSGCVRASVVDAMQYGFRPLVVSDCVGDRAIGPHEANLFDMRQKYATVLTRDEALRATRA